MSFLTTRLLIAPSTRSLYNNLTTSFRSLCVAPNTLLQKVKPKTDISPATTITDRNVSLHEQKECQSVFENVNNLITSNSEGRLFAVVQLCGKQYKITAGDIVLVEGYWPPTIGDKIRLDKVLLAGANDFTLIGRPILEPGLVDVQATIIEKTLTHTKTHFKKKRRKQYKRINFQRSPNTMIRINSIEMGGKVNQPAKEKGNEVRIF